MNTQTAQIQVLAGGWTDVAGNAGTASNTLSITEDTQAPTVVVSGSSATLAAGETATITFAFSGAVSGFDLSDVSVTGGALSNLQPVAGDPTHYTAIFTPAAGVNTQTAQIQVLAGGWTDAAGNAGTASNTLSITEDTQAPTVVVSGSSATLAAGETATITFAFSEAVTGFDLSDVSVTGGALSDLQPVASDPRTIRPYSRRRRGRTRRRLRSSCWRVAGPMWPAMRARPATRCRSPRTRKRRRLW